MNFGIVPKRLESLETFRSVFWVVFDSIDVLNRQSASSRRALPKRDVDFNTSFCKDTHHGTSDELSRTTPLFCCSFFSSPNISTSVIAHKNISIRLLYLSSRASSGFSHVNPLSCWLLICSRTAVFPALEASIENYLTIWTVLLLHLHRYAYLVLVDVWWLGHRAFSPYAIQIDRVFRRLVLMAPIPKLFCQDW